MTFAPHTRRLPSVLLAALALLLISVPAASAASKLTIRGAGFGHGVGMSQYGAYGMAREGWNYSQILRHYYTGTELGVTDPNRPVRVLVGSGTTVSFRGASAAGGRQLDPSTTYHAASIAGSVTLLSPTRRELARFGGPVQVSGPAGLTTGGRSYRGVLELRAAGTGVNVINVVNLEQYVRGVVAWESPPSWPIEALKAQAVAARTYAITTSKNGAGFDQYADTRSQVYGGMNAETPSTDRAVAETSGHVVTYGGAPVVTYFFSTSGGRTENVENVWRGATSPWLRSVSDPFDDSSPKHRWKPAHMTLRQAEQKLGDLVKGRLRGIRVVQRGASPRIVAADVVGTRGSTRVSGATLRLHFGLADTWAYFTSLTARAGKPLVETPAGTPEGGVSSARGRKASTAGSIRGTLMPATRRSKVRVQQRVDGRWRSVGRVGVDARGRYAAGIDEPGLYRVVKGGATGPAVRVR